MNTENLMSILGSIGIGAGVVGAVLLTIFGLMMMRLYKTASKKEALIRTGVRGEQIVFDGGMMVIPSLQELQRVPLTTEQFEVYHQQKEALITEDSRRIDVHYKVAMHIDPTPDAVRKAAQTLDDLNDLHGTLKTIALPKVVAAMRQVAVSMKMRDLYKNRNEFRQAIITAVMSDLAQNGLVLEGISIEALDQTAMEYWNEDNVYDAEGLIEITKEVEASKKERNDIKRENEVLIATRDLAAHQKTEELKRDEEFATLEKERLVSVRKSEQEAEMAKSSSEQNKASEVARIQAEEATESAEIGKKLAIKEATINSTKKERIAEQNKEVEIHKKSQEVSEQSAIADEKKATAVTAREKVVTAEKVATAERSKQVAVIDAKKDAEVKNANLVVESEAKKTAAADNAEASRLEATGIADAVSLKAEGEAKAINALADANERKYAVDAEGNKIANEAANTLSSEQVTMQIQKATIAALPSIIAESVKPMEAIDSVRIVQADGLGVANNGNGGSNNGSTSNGSLPEQFMNSALQYRVGQKLVDSMMSSVGLSGNDFEGLTKLPAETLEGMAATISKAAGKEVKASDLLEEVKELASELSSTDEKLYSEEGHIDDIDNDHSSD